MCFNASSSRRMRLAADAVTLLDLLGDWTTAEALSTRASDLGPVPMVRRLLSRMWHLGLLEKEGASVRWPWQKWSPEAAFFHFGTRGGRYPADARDYDGQLRRKALHDPPPAPTKSIRGRRVRLSSPRDMGTLSRALGERRTWRHFGSAPVAFEDLSTLLKITWGVQKWGAVTGQGRVALKTSPSGGARHSIEAYVLARHVAGVRAGVYHYDAATHQLVDLRRRVSSAVLTRLLANQFYYGSSGAAIVMSAVFARAMWRYPYSKSFRSVLTEAGHLAQTFCVSATALGLAPFCTMAFHENEMDQFIRIDGINEAALYVVGVGTRSRRHANQPGRLETGEHP